MEWLWVGAPGEVTRARARHSRALRGEWEWAREAAHRPLVGASVLSIVAARSCMMRMCVGVDDRKRRSCGPRGESEGVTKPFRTPAERLVAKPTARFTPHVRRQQLRMDKMAQRP